MSKRHFDGSSVLYEDDLDSSYDKNSNLLSNGGASTRRSLVATEPESYSSNSDSDPHKATLASEETKAVNRSKILVYLVLLICAGSVGWFTYSYVSNQQYSDFENKYKGYSQELLDRANGNAKDYYGKLLSLSRTLTSTVIHDPALKWPYVTLPNFDIRCTNSYEKFAGVELIIWSPIVPAKNESEWVEYSVDNQGWIREDLDSRGLVYVEPGEIPEEIHSPIGGEQERGDQFFAPIWQMGPVPTNASIINLNLFSNPSFRRMIDEVKTTRHLMLSEAIKREFLVGKIATLDHDSDRDKQPRSYAVEPVFDAFTFNSTIVGFMSGLVPWDSYFKDVLPPGTNGIIVEVDCTCGTPFSYLVNGPSAKFLGDGRHHSSQYSNLKLSVSFAEFARYDVALSQRNNATHCNYTLTSYPTDALKAEFENNNPIIYSMVIVSVFIFTALVFIFYDYKVQRRQNKVMATANRTTMVVASLFPKNVQKRIMEEVEQQVNEQTRAKRTFSFAPKAKLKEFMNENENDKSNLEGRMDLFKTKPIADLFPNCTVMFADLVGFTAWSSTREPSQVFTLLETIYHAFDEIAGRRKVFKVETVGDCYVAVTGLPEPQKDHASIMARFAHECLRKLEVLLNQLEVELGPDTADLGIRIGIHSGPVTAGVLRGERARFQLFGDTVNTTARIESTGMRNRIHVSEETAAILIEAGKEHWLDERGDKVAAKGKGMLKTFWLEIQRGATPSAVDSGCSSHDEFSSRDFSSSFDVGGYDPTVTDQSSIRNHMSEKYMRLVDWNSDTLIRMLKQMVARREACQIKPDPIEVIRRLEQRERDQDKLVLDEVEDVITLPMYNHDAAKNERDFEDIYLDEDVCQQVHEYVMALASMYHPNAFHNFEHASHVTMSVIKLLSRIVAPDMEVEVEDDAEALSSLHDHTYGITSDPVTQFAVVLAALIHDTDHQGVPNAQLIKEETPASKAYKCKSVAEQNSVDLAWGLLMSDRFDSFRRLIYTTEGEFQRFRQLIVNSVMATDIMDKDLGNQRKARWNIAFADTAEDLGTRDHINRKATIVIEHLIQASDVCHTMQHWHVYRKWNKRFFEECYRAYAQGRADKDPSDNWYNGEIGFFDYYIIPLATKLKTCGVFGVSSDEYLNYAQQNRQEWEARGQEVVAEMVEGVKKQYAKRESTR